MKIRSALAVILALFFAFISRLSVAESTGAQNLAPMQASAATIKKVSFTPASPAFAKSNLPERIAGEQEVLVFSAPPHETEAEALRTYRPIAEYLTRVIGKKSYSITRKTGSPTRRKCSRAAMISCSTART